MSQDLDSVPTRAELGFPVYQERGSDLNVDVGHGDAGYSSETEPSSPSPAMDEESSTEVPVQILEHASSESEPAASVQQGGPAVPDTTHHPTDSSAQATTTLAFDPEVVLAMHYQLNEKNFALLQEGTEVMQISEEIGRSASSGLECTICLDAIESGQMMTKVPCDGGHKFHSECLNRWMGTKLFNAQPAFCPNCNFKILEPLRTREPERRAPARAPVHRMTVRQKLVLMIIPLLLIVPWVVSWFLGSGPAWIGARCSGDGCGDKVQPDPASDYAKSSSGAQAGTGNSAAAAAAGTRPTR